MTTTAELETFTPITPTDPMRVGPGDRRRAASILSAAITGDHWALTSEVAAVQLAGRTGPTVEALAALLVESVPQLRSTELVDRLRELSAPQVVVAPKPIPRPPTEPGLYSHDEALYQVVRTQDGQRLYVKAWDEDARKFVYDRDGLKINELYADDRVSDDGQVFRY